MFAKKSVGKLTLYQRTANSWPYKYPFPPFPAYSSCHSTSSAALFLITLQLLRQASVIATPQLSEFQADAKQAAALPSLCRDAAQPVLDDAAHHAEGARPQGDVRCAGVDMPEFHAPALAGAVF